MLRDVLLALRWLRKDKFLTTATILILAIGIGANTAIFSVVDAVLLRPLPYASPERLVRIEESSTSRNMPAVPVKDYLRWSGRPDLFEAFAEHFPDTVTLTQDGEPEQVIAVRSVGLFPLLGVSARKGRTLTAADDEPGARDVAVIGDRLWRRRYQADENIIGREITVSGTAYTVVGLMPADFEFRYPDAELWTSMRIASTTPWFQIAGRLRPDVPVTQVRNALEVVARQMEQESPKELGSFQIRVTPWSDMPEEKYRLTILFTLAAVGLVMVIACANVGSLLLSRTVQRQREIAIRASLGASWSRLVRQLLSESLVLGVFGSMAGLVVARFLLAVLLEQLAALPVAIPHVQRVAFNERVLGFNVILGLAVAALCGLAPILLLAKSDLQALMRPGQGATATRASARLFSSLIGLETGLAFLLLVSSGLMIRSLIQLQQEDRGFRPDHVLTLRVPVGSFTQPRPTGKYDTRPRQMAYYRQILERVKAAPGIRVAAIVNNPPLSGISSSLNFTFSRERQPELFSARTISPEYFLAMGIPLAAGRTFGDHDTTEAPRVAIINEYLARQLFPGGNPLGEKLLDGGPNESGAVIVGVAGNSPQLSYEAPPKGEVYIPYQQYMFATFMSTLIVRTEGAPTALAATIKKEVWAIDPAQPVVKVETMEQVIANSIWRPRLSAWIGSVLTGVSLLLTALGVYGVVAYTSGLRAREVAIRIALGATPRTVALIILWRAMIPVVVGLGVSIGAALLLSRLLSNLLYGVSGTDPVTYFGAGLLLLLIGGAASLRPAWMAATRDPLASLRSE